MEDIFVNEDSFIIDSVRFNIRTDDVRLAEEQRMDADRYVTRRESSFTDEVNISYTKDAEFFEELLRAFEISTDTETIPTFKGEKHYRFKNGTIDVYAKDNGEYFAFVINGKDVVIVGNPKADTHEFPFRIVREILVRKMEDQQYVFTHGTGFNVNGRGYCIVANSGGGKTTLMTKMLEHSTGSKIVSNDRVFIKNVDGQLTMKAFPIPIVYAMGTVKSSPRLAERFERYGLTNARWGIDLNETQNGQKLEFNLTDVEEVFDCELSTSEKIDIMIIPKINRELGDKVIAKPMDSREAKAVLEANSFTPVDTESERAQWIYQRESSLEQLEANKTAAISAELGVPILYVEYGLDATPETVLNAVENAVKKIENQSGKGE